MSQYQRLAVFAVALLLQSLVPGVLRADDVKEATLKPLTDIIVEAMKKGDRDLLSGAIPSKAELVRSLKTEPSLQKVGDDAVEKLAVWQAETFAKTVAESFDEVQKRIKKRGIELAESKLIGFYTEDGKKYGKDLLKEPSIEVLIVMRYDTTHFMVKIQKCKVFDGKRKTIGRLLDKGNMREKNLRAIGLEVKPGKPDMPNQ